MKPPEDLRRRILDASLELIAGEGLEAFSMREVARRAGVSHQAPYHHFPDREAIMAAIVTEGFALLRADLQAARQPDASAAEWLTALGKAYVAFALRQPAHFKLMFRSELVNADRHDEARISAEGALEVLTSAINDLARDMNREPDRLMPLMAWAVAHGLSTLLLEGKLKRLCGDSMQDQRAAADEVLERFQDLIRTSAD